jgi:hypothetical protein
LKNVQVGYTLPQPFSQKLGLQHIGVYFSGENLLTLTSLPSGFDPETAIDADGRGPGKSHFAQSIFAFGLDLRY